MEDVVTTIDTQGRGKLSSILARWEELPAERRATLVRRACTVTATLLYVASWRARRQDRRGRGRVYSGLGTVVAWASSYLTIQLSSPVPADVDSVPWDDAGSGQGIDGAEVTAARIPRG